MKKLTLREFRVLVRQLVNEYVANDDQNPHKDVHNDPTGKDWDKGLDEAEEDGMSDHPHMGGFALGEVDSDKSHEGDPRWDDHADPTGKEWHAGLSKAD
jgi:hypothetical protein